MPNESEKSANEDASAVKCPKYGHEFYCDPGWIEASAMIGCPKCSAVIRVRKPDGDQP